jgi:hypothetical protein
MERTIGLWEREQMCNAGFGPIESELKMGQTCTFRSGWSEDFIWALCQKVIITL